MQLIKNDYQVELGTYIKYIAILSDKTIKHINTMIKCFYDKKASKTLNCNTCNNNIDYKKFKCLSADSIVFYNSIASYKYLLYQMGIFAFTKKEYKRFLQVNGNC